MAGRKAPGPAWLVILEDIRSQNRVTLEAVGGLAERMDRFERDNHGGFVRSTEAHFLILELAIREVSARLSAMERDLRTLTARVASFS